MIPHILSACIVSCSMCASSTPSTMCSACRSALYCGRACQRQHWAAHRPVCAQLQATAAAATAAACSLDFLFDTAAPPCSAATQAARLELVRCMPCPSLTGPQAEPRSAFHARLKLVTALMPVCADSPTQVEVFGLLRAALATGRQVGGCDCIVALSVATHLAGCLFDCDRLEEAMALFRDTHARACAAHGELGQPTLITLLTLLRKLREVGGEALGERQARSLLAKVVGKPAPASATAREVTAAAIDTIDEMMKQMRQ